MRKFNGGRACDGSNAVKDGKLRGATDREGHFYFFCPKCPDDEIMRILEYGVTDEAEKNPYNDQCHSKAQYGFTQIFKLHCDKCGHTDFVRIGNLGWQGGQHRQTLDRL